MKYSVFVFLISIIWISGCECDEFSEEVALETTFFGIKQPLFAEIQVKNAIKSVPVQPEIKTADTIYYYKLPLDSNRDTTSYFFRQAEKWDTVQISYARKFAFNDKNECGYTIEIQNPRILQNTFPFRAFIEISPGSNNLPNKKAKTSKLTFLP